MLNLFKSKLSEKDFGKKYFDKLSKKVQGLKFISLEGLELRTKIDGQDEMRHLLDNSYAEYKNDSKDLDEIIEKYTNASKELFEPKEAVSLDRIVPIIKDQRFINETLKLNPDFEKDFLIERYNDELFIFYAENKETTIGYLKRDEIESLNVDFEELRKKAIQNLGELATKIERHGEDGQFMLTMGGDFESSLILLKIWDKENFPVKGEVVIAIPARDLILITGSDDSENLEKVKAKVKEINETGDHVVSDRLFILKNDKFVMYE
ncbi:MAG: hypothetical protein ACJAQ2_001924 [Vicingaceae bacterium]|jgi:uncharacterized protein YtpQ (UPF0354 family)